MVEFETRTLGPSTWPAFVRLAEKHNGIWGGCWCTYFQGTPGWGERSPAQRRADKEERVRDGTAHGILVFEEGVPVGWCQFGPPAELQKADRFRGYRAKVPVPPDWRITCFFVDRDHRRQGVARAALRGAMREIAKAGGGVVEAYPTPMTRRSTSASFLWHGTPSMFEGEGFTVYRRLASSRLVFRRSVSGLVPAPPGRAVPGRGARRVTWAPAGPR